MLSPLFLHLPHASSVIPEDFRGDFLVGTAELASEQLRLEDRYTDELFGAGWPAAQAWRAPVSRLVVDVERFRSDDHEPCAAVGMGAVYVRGTRGQALRRPDPERREVLLKTYYDPHHRACEAATAQALATWGRCVVLDAHSYPRGPLPTQLPDALQPEIGLGTDAFHTPLALRELARSYFADHGLEVGVDEPFCGTFVPTRFWRSDPRVHSLMVEVRRDLYMDEATGAKNGGFARIQDLLSGFRAVLAKHALE
jgi:N-formylglutamate deformylase